MILVMLVMVMVVVVVVVVVRMRSNATTMATMRIRSWQGPGSRSRCFKSTSSLPRSGWIVAAMELAS